MIFGRYISFDNLETFNFGPTNCLYDDGVV